MSICVKCNDTDLAALICGQAVVRPPIASNEERAANQSTLNRASSNKFILVLDIPSMVDLGGARGEICGPESLDRLEYNIFGHDVPEVSIPAQSVDYNGHTLNLSSHKRENGSPLEVRFLVDNLYSNYWVIWKWLDLMWKEDEGIAGYGDVRKLPPKEYMTKITIYALDGYNTRRISWTYHNVFATKLGGINYDHQDQDGIKSSFSFAYSHVTCSKH